MDCVVLRVKRAANGWTVEQFDDLDLDSEIADIVHVAGDEAQVAEIVRAILERGE